MPENPRHLPWVVAVLLLAAGSVGAFLLWRDPAPVEPPPTRPAEVWLEPTGPRAAKVWVEGSLLGEIVLGSTGKVTGDALIRLPTQAKLLAFRPVEVISPPGLDPDVAQAVYRMLFRAGATESAVVYVGSATRGDR